MRFYEFKVAEQIFEQKLFESSRGVIGVVTDNQAGKENIFALAGGGKFEPQKFYMYPKDPQKLSYIDEIIKTPVPGPDNADPETPGNDKKLSADDQFEEDLKQDGLLGAKLIDCNTRPTKQFAALVIEVATDRGILLFAKYPKAKNKMGLYVWKQTDFKADVAAKGYALEDVVPEGSKKTHAAVRLFPNRAGITDSVIPIDSVTATLRGSTGGVETDFPLTEREIVADLIDGLGTGQDIPCTADYYRNYEVQAGEIAAPIALVKNLNVTGSYLEAQQGLLDYMEKGLTWQNITGVEYPSDEAEQLIDSYLISPKGARIGVSSKDSGGGAKASASAISNILAENKDKIIERVPNFFNDPANKKMFRYMEIINEPNKSHQMYKFAAETKHISTAQRDQLIAILNKGGDAYNDAQGIINIVGDEFYNQCISSYNPRNTNDPRYRIFFHFTCGLAKIAANTMNSDVEVVDRFFRTCLESSNMVQVKAKFKQNGDKGSYQNFQVIYPPVFKGTIRFNPFKKLTAQVKPEGMAFEIGK